MINEKNGKLPPGLKQIVLRSGMSENTIRRRVKDSAFPAYKVKGIWFAYKDEIDDWIVEHDFYKDKKKKKRKK